MGCVRSKASRIAIAPSPTAVATRLAEPARTSPTAKMPGWLVSSSERSAPSGPGPGREKSVSMGVAHPAEPAGARGHADEDEQRPGVDGAPRAGPVVGDG